MSRRNLNWLLGIAAVAIFGFVVASFAHTQEKDKALALAGDIHRKLDGEKDYELVRLVVEVLHEVETKYVVELDGARKRKLVEDMVNGGLERLDPHSAYINPKEYKHFEKTNRGKFGGIGIQVGYDRQNRGQLTVVCPMPGTPAYKARGNGGEAILAGDAILKIDGKATENLRVSDAVDLIQGDPGQKIILTLLHEGGKDSFDVAIVREEIKIQSVMGDLRRADDPEKWDYFVDAENKIGYMRLTNFSETATDEVKQALETMQKQGMRALILDLRNNPGGLLRAAVEISNLFLKDGRIVSTKGRNHKEEVYDAKPQNALNLPEGFPIAILVNKYSASASEIVAAALQDNGRAVVVGERSYGKGSVQNIILMDKEKEPSALKLTTASYWRPSGKNIHRFPDSKESDDWGVRPSEGLEVPMKDEERYNYMIWRSERDVPSSRLKEKEEKPGAEKKKEFKDRVLEKALDHMRKEIKAAALMPERGNA
jgi:carboxyl-terminal processing protease